jgi:hypothetical protein
MRYFRSADPDRDFEILDMLQSQREARLPVCDNCHRPINDDIYFDIEGDIYCEMCLHDEFGRSTEDYLSDNY